MGLTLGGNVRGTKATEPILPPSPRRQPRWEVSSSMIASPSRPASRTTMRKLDDRQFQDQNRNQWLVTNTAQVGSYVGSPSASTLSTLPGGQTYIDPQLGYFSDILQQVKTTGASFGAEWRWTDQITSTFNYFYVNQEDESTTYSDKAWFSGGSGQTNHPGAPGFISGNRSLAALQHRRARRGSVGHLHGQWRRDLDAVSEQQFARQQLPVRDSFRRRRPVYAAMPPSPMPKRPPTCRRRKPTSSMAFTAHLTARRRSSRPRRAAITVATPATTAITGMHGPGTTVAAADFRTRDTPIPMVTPTSCPTRPTRCSNPTGPGPTRRTRPTSPSWAI